MSDAHIVALNKTIEYLDGAHMLEITYKYEFGFIEIGNRTNISIDDFLKPEFNEQQDSVAVFHICLGCGVPIGKLIEAISKAIILCERVIVLEHNRNSKDWNWDDTHVVEDHFLKNCIGIEDFPILCDLLGWLLLRAMPMEGNISSDRNFIVELAGGVLPINYNDKFAVPAYLGIPIFSNGVSVPNFQNFYDVYVGTAESQTRFLLNKNNMPLTSEPYTFYASCGGFMSLNYIHLLRSTIMKEIVVFDINPHSVEFAQTVFDLIRDNDTIGAFLSNYLLVNIKYDRGYKIAPTIGGDKIKLYLKNYPFYNKTSKKIFKLILNANGFVDGLAVYGLRNCADNRTDLPGKLLISYLGDKFIDINSLGVGVEGWIETNISYQETREVLKNVPIRFIVSSIEDIRTEIQDIMYASNIFTSFNDPIKKANIKCRVIEG